jgi:hypothetical protein
MRGKLAAVSFSKFRVVRVFTMRVVASARIAGLLSDYFTIRMTQS